MAPRRRDSFTPGQGFLDDTTVKHLPPFLLFFLLLLLLLSLTNQVLDPGQALRDAQSRDHHTSSNIRGPRLSFDDDPHENDDDNEMMMLGEEARRKKNRVWTGGRAQLDLVPLRDWEEDQAREEKERDKGWSSATAAVEAESKGKKSLEMLGDEENVEIRHRVQHSTQSRLDRPMSASPSDPETENDEPFPLSARSKPRMIESQPSFADSSESDAGEYLQQCLVGGRGDELVPSSSPDAKVLVCDSDEETLDRLAYQFGRGGVDDSGFAEYNDDGEEDGGCEERGDVGMILPSSQPRLDEVTTLEPEKRKAVGLERSESSILMPPPPVPVRQQARQVVKMEEVPPPQARDEVSFDEIETQWAVHSPIKSRPTATHETIPNRPSTWSSLDAAWQGARPLTPPPPPEPRQANLLEFFSKTHEARGDEGEEDQENWIIEDSQPGLSIPLGQHEMRAFQAALITTREMGKKKIRGGNGLGGIEEEEDIEEAEEEVDEVEVPSSDQEDGPWSPLGSPVRMRFPGSGIAKETEMVQLDAVEEEDGKDVRGDDDAESVPEAEELGDDSMDFLPPLPSFPPSSQMSSTQRDRIKSREGSGEMEEAEREETQWESYWTVEAVEPSPFHALMDDDEEEDENV
ncbi:BZ3501_MvSof-1269-A2-R1_Chr7-2g09316 [Microbotryum saponariae]|nr:BZ3501_MvSof-1269-A2-R1_Chr7-2g09316 [Microbotryum saponariae]